MRSLGIFRRSMLRAIAGFAACGIAVAAVVAVTQLRGTESRAQVKLPTEEAVKSLITVSNASIAHDLELSPGEIPDVAAATVTAPNGLRLPQGSFLVGAARASLLPAPEVFGQAGDEWQVTGCTDVDAGELDTDHALPKATELPFPAGWLVESPNCIYLGGFGIGPVRPALRLGHGGVWVRTIAISNGEKTFIYSIADTVGWFARYRENINLATGGGPIGCTDCGILDVRNAVAQETGIEVADINVGATHTHAGADTYGGWGGIPLWYRYQLRDATVASAKQAIANLKPASIKIGDPHIRQRNNERRDTYFSTADTGAPWLQALTLPNANGQGGGRVIATMATYAAHPTIVNEEGGAPLHADWPGAAARRLEALYNRASMGTVGLMFEGGLGNVSVSGLDGATQEERAENTGKAIAELISSDIKVNAVTLTSNDMAASSKQIVHPTDTNLGLISLATVGLFDRETEPGTAGAGPLCSYSWSRTGETFICDPAPPFLVPPQEENNAPSHPEWVQSCITPKGPTVITVAGAHRIGELVIAFGPGELFSNITEAVRERADNNVALMVLGQTNDALGYIMQSFEYDVEGQIVIDAINGGIGEYEETFAIDKCFGDHVLQTMLEATVAVGAGGL